MNNADLHVADLSQRYLLQIPDATLEVGDSIEFLDLSGNPSMTLYNSLSRFTNLTTLRLNKCNLCLVPDGICDLTKLVKLDLAFNVQLEALCPSLGKLRSLKELDMSRCRLKTLPDSIEELLNLEILRIAGNYTYRCLPSSIGKLLSLKELDVSSCSLDKIPEALWELSKLEKLRIAHNYKLRCISSSIENLRSLKEFDASGCRLQSIPETFWELRNLEVLLLAGNCDLKSLSFRIMNLRLLKELDMSRCGLERLPEDFWNLSKLEKLRLSGNYNLRDLGLSDGNLRLLKEFDVTHCGLENLPETFWDIQNLEKVALNGDQQLANFCSSIKNVNSLKEVHLMECGFKRLPSSFAKLQAVELLTLGDNKELETLNFSRGELQSLRNLRVMCCGLRKVDDTIANLLNLEVLRLEGNPQLESLCDAFGSLRSLKDLRIVSCGLTCLPDSFADLDNLVTLRLQSNPKLETLCEQFGKLQSLKELHIISCGIKCLPDSFKDLHKLATLTLEGSPGIESLCESFGKLQSLKDVRIVFCGLRCLPDSFANLHNLQTLNLSSNQLEVYPSCTLRLRELKVLDLSNASLHGSKNSIKDLPVEVANTNLIELKLLGNPISSPPEEIWKQGFRAIQSFMKNHLRGWERIRADTINIIGDTNAGKTSIAQSLVEGIPHAAEKDDCTRVMQQLWVKDHDGFSVHVNDFGGHCIYHSVIPIFLPSNGLVLIAYNLEKEVDAQEKEVKKWLLTAIAKSKSTSIRVVIAGTRSDLVSDVVQKKKEMSAFSKDLLQNLTAEIDCNKIKLRVSRQNSKERELDELTTLSKKIKQAKIDVVSVSCVIDDGSVANLKSLVLQSLRRPDEMPVRWCEVMDHILTKCSDVLYLKMDDIRCIYQLYVTDDAKCTDLTYILRYLVSSAQIIWLERNRNLCEFVFHSPQKIIDICKLVLDHNQALQLASEWAAHFTSEVRQYKEGILSESLFTKLLSNYDHVQCDVILNFLVHFNVISEVKVCETSFSKERAFVVPSNLSEVEPAIVPSFEKEFCQYTNSVCLRLHCLGCIVPMSFFETSMSAMLTAARSLDAVGPVTKFWKDGLFVQHNKIKFAAKRLENTITLMAGSSCQKRSPWCILHSILTALQESISSSWAGAPPRCHVLCPRCRWLSNRQKTQEIGEIEIPMEYFCASDQSTVSTNATLTCPTCYADVPRSLCLPVSLDEHSSEEQKEIEAFYNSLSDQHNIQTCDLRLKFGQAYSLLVAELDRATVDRIVDKLIAAQDGTVLIADEECQRIRAENMHLPKARLLLEAINKRGVAAIRELAVALSSTEIARDDLARLLQ